jgi:hypothetical protein
MSRTREPSDAAAVHAPTSRFRRLAIIGSQHACHAVFAAAVVCLALQPRAVARHVPDIYAPLASQLANVSVLESLPPHPTTLSQAWRLGELQAALSGCGNGLGGTAAAAARAAALAEAGELLGWQGPLTTEQLETARELTLASDAGGSWVTRVLGALSFVNTVWAAALVGVTATVGPVLAQLAAQLGLWSMIAGALKRWYRVLMAVLMHPWVRALHVPVCDALAYCVFVHGLAYREGGSPRTFIMLAGVAAALVPLLALQAGVPGLGRAYWVVVPARPASDGLPATPSYACACDAVPSMTARGAYLAVVLLALVHVTGSSLMAYMGMAAGYSALGFIVGAFYGGFLVGFEDEGAVSRAGSAAIAVVVAATVVHIVQPAWLLPGGPLAPYGSSLQVMGNVVLFMAVLIATRARWGSSSESSWGYWSLQLRAAALFAAAIGVGSVYGIPALANTATVFAVLWVEAKTVDFGLWSGANVTFMVFATSLAAWRAALYLHTHPSLVVAMFTTDARMRAVAASAEAVGASKGSPSWAPDTADVVALGFAGLIYAMVGINAVVRRRAAAREAATEAARLAAREAGRRAGGGGPGKRRD